MDAATRNYVRQRAGHRWDDHFEWHGVLIVGTTPVGRTTVRVLQLNAEERLQLRVASSQ
jgi:hypothetical protein